MQHLQLPGRIGQTSGKGQGLIVGSATLALAVLVGLLILSSRIQQPQASDAPPAAVAQQPPSVHPPSPDTSFHITSLRAQLLSATEETIRAQRLLAGIEPELR